MRLSPEKANHAIPLPMCIIHVSLSHQCEIVGCGQREIWRLATGLEAGQHGMDGQGQGHGKRPGMSPVSKCPLTHPRSFVLALS